MRFASNEYVFRYPASTEAEFQASKIRYSYEKTPLNAKVLGTEETETWRREEIGFDGFGGERAKAYLYLPKNAAPPYQVVHFLGGTNLWYGVPVTDGVESKARAMLPYLRAGRALFMVVLKGFAGREPVGGYVGLERSSAIATCSCNG